MDDLERRIRAARPISGHRDLPLSDRAKRELADLMLADSAHHAPKRRLARRRRKVIARLSATAAIAALAVAGVLVGTSIFSSQGAYAATPHLLPVTATDENAQEVLTRLSQRASEAAASGTASSSVQVETWTLPTQVEGEEPARVILPEVYLVTQTDDGQVTQVVITGGASDAGGNPVSGPDVPAEGQVVSEQTYPIKVEWSLDLSDSGDVLAAHAALPGGAVLVRQFFEAAMGDASEPSAADVIRTTNELLLAQVLSPTQQAALLAYFAELPDLSLVGTTVDRLGREGLLFMAADPAQPQYEEALIISAETGKILGTEVLYIGTERTDIASPSVVQYSVWK